MPLLKLSPTLKAARRISMIIIIYQSITSFTLCKAHIISLNESLCTSNPCSIWDYTWISPYISSSLRLPCCASCTCDRTKCHIYGSYCNETNTILLEQFALLPSSVFKCETLQLKHGGNGEYPVQNYNVYTNRSCPFSYQMDSTLDVNMITTIDKCEHTHNYNNLETTVPVSDLRTGLTYGNYFCAQCHGIPDDAIIFWNPRIQCYHESYLPTNYSTIVTDIQMLSSCNIIFEKPADLGLILPSCALYIGTHCRIHINAVCFASSTETTAVCNIDPFREDSGSLFMCLEPVFDLPLFQSFALVFRYNPLEIPTVQREVEVQEELGCGPNAFDDQFKDKCRDLTCTPARSLQNNICQNTFKTIRGAIVEVFIKMTPVRRVPSSNVSHIGEAIGEFGREMMANISAAKYSIGLFVTANSSLVELYLVLHVLVTIENDIDVNVTFIDSLLQIGGTSVTLVGNTFITELIQLQLLSEVGGLYNIVDNETLTLYDTLQVKVSDVAPFSPTITLLSTSGCTLVTLDVDEFDIHNFTWGIRVSELNVNISHWHVIHHVNVTGILTSVQICASMYSDLIQPFVHKSMEFSDYNSTETRNTLKHSSAVTVGILSLVCTCFSVVCTLLTVLTYGLFQDLRTQPGINNIALCVNLAIAQMMFQFGIGQRDNLSEWACVLIGISIHFFWLSTVMWMNVCCIHSFEVLWTLHKNRDNKKSSKRMVLYILYATSLASLPIVVNIVLHIIADDGNTGYGQAFCYIANNKVISLTFALPIGFIILINISLFIIIIFKLSHTTFLNPATGKERQFYGVYVRLSILTGFLWIFGFIYMFTGEEWLEYIFVILNASQGVFIFASFVCNKTCARKYLSLLHGHSPSSQTRGTRISNYTTTRKSLS